MLALFAGTGALPGEIAAALQANQTPFVVCEMEGFPAELAGEHDKKVFRIERLGSLLRALREDGVVKACFAGAVRRPVIDASVIDAATAPLVPRLQEAMARGDDGALRGIIAVFEAEGIRVVAAHEIAPDLLPAAGLLSGAPPDDAVKENLEAAIARHLEMSEGDIGQAVVTCDGCVVASEGPDGTDAMLATLASDGCIGGLLYKAPKLGQDRRADLPVIGPQTIKGAMRCGIQTVVIEAGGVMVLGLDEVCSLAQEAGVRLWVREAGQ